MRQKMCLCVFEMCVSVRLSGLYPLHVLLSRQRSQTELMGRMCVSRRLEVVVEADSSCCHFLSGSGMFTPLMGVGSSDTHLHTSTHIHQTTHLLCCAFTHTQSCRDNSRFAMIITFPPLI